eukprot:753886-Hanusia_phi.AAC.5
MQPQHLEEGGQVLGRLQHPRLDIQQLQLDPLVMDRGKIARAEAEGLHEGLSERKHNAPALGREVMGD